MRVHFESNIPERDLSHLQLVRGRYRVRIVVPPALRAIIGKESLVKSLGTGNRAKAERLAVPYIAEFSAMVAEAASAEHYNYHPKARFALDAFIGFQYHNNLKRKRHYNYSDAKTASSEWYSPPRVFEAMGVEFDMDVASPGAATVPWIPAKRHLTPAEDGLNTPWEGFIWLNPPYGLRNGMQAWLDKFVAHRNGVVLLPGYTYTKWWHDFVVEVDCLLFPLFKLQFISPQSDGRNCTLANCLTAIGENGTRALQNAASNGLGRLFELIS